MTDPVRRNLAVRHSSSLLLKYAAYVQLHVFTWLQITKKPPSTRTTHASPTCFIPPTHYSWSSVVIILHVARIRLIVNCYSTLQYSVLLQTLFAIKQSIRYFYYFARLCELWFFSGDIYGSHQSLPIFKVLFEILQKRFRVIFGVIASLGWILNETPTHPTRSIDTRPDLIIFGIINWGAW